MATKGSQIDRPARVWLLSIAVLAAMLVATSAPATASQIQACFSPPLPGGCDPAAVVVQAITGAPMPDLFIRGAGTYTANLNADNSAGTMQSIEHTLRAFDKAAEDERRQIERPEKPLTDYQAQANRPFEHEAHLKELLARQAQINAVLDLDKSDAQAAEPAVEPAMETAARVQREPTTTPGPERISAMGPRL